MKLPILATLLGLTLSQPPRQCVYHDAGGSPFVLNLTTIQEWTLEKETSQFFYYYTPCHNGLQCHQGNANFAANVAQYQPGANQCQHYLSVDHHEPPFYDFAGASWLFRYEDGEICDSTQSPRRTTIAFQCDEAFGSPTAFFYDIGEPRQCEYLLEIRSRLACIPEESHNANCQWRVANGTGGYYYLDLSSLNTTVLRGGLFNGYMQYLSPCRNGLHCYQQAGEQMVMTSVENRATDTCEHYGAVWDDGRNQPMIHGVGTPDQHWSFMYHTGETCSDGTPAFQEVRYFCDENAVNATVLASYINGDCRFYMNVSTSHACI